MASFYSRVVRYKPSREAAIQPLQIAICEDHPCRMQPPDRQDIASWRTVVRLGQFGVQVEENSSKQITHIFCLNSHRSFPFNQLSNVD